MAISRFLNRRNFIVLAAAAGLIGLSGMASAAPVQGKDFQVLAAQQPTDNPGKVEILEFFSFACPHCADLEPRFADWARKQGKDVAVRRVPVTFNNPRWEPLAKLYFTLDILGEADRVTPLVFNAIHKEDRNLADESAQFDWVVSKGVDRKKYLDAYKSFSMGSKLQRSNQQTGAFRISGVPAVAVDGKYLTSVSMTGGFEAFFATLDALVARARAEKGKK